MALGSDKRASTCSSVNGTSPHGGYLGFLKLSNKAAMVVVMDLAETLAEAVFVDVIYAVNGRWMKRVNGNPMQF